MKVGDAVIWLQSGYPYCGKVRAVEPQTLLIATYYGSRQEDFADWVPPLSDRRLTASGVCPYSPILLEKLKTVYERRQDHWHEGTLAIQRLFEEARDVRT